MTRAQWKAFWRQCRIIARERGKALRDAAIFGTGYVRVSNEGFVNHILPEAVLIESDGSVRLPGDRS